MGTIYILKNKENDKYYVGQTSRSFNKRFREHCQSRSLVGTALRKYGSKKFERIIIEDVPSEKLDELEIQYIKEYNSISPNGYNLMHGGNGGLHSEESKQKMSASQLKRFENEPSPRKGVHLTDETKQKLSKSLQGKFTGENNPFYGKHHTEEAIEKNRKAHLGKETWMKGKTHSEEIRQKMSEAKKGKPSAFKGKAHTEESKQKNREAHLGKTPSNKGIRIPHLCICGKPVKEKYSGNIFKGYNKTCGSKECLDVKIVVNELRV